MLEIESTKKVMKRLTGDIDLIETYHLSLGDFVKHKIGGSYDLNQFLFQIQNLIANMRNICGETSLNIS